MIAYHIDTKNVLRPGFPLLLRNLYPSVEKLPFWNDLFPEGVSAFGLSLLESHQFGNKPLFTSQAINEFCFEYVRRIKFPQIPSRFQSFFSCSAIEYAQKWIVDLRHALQPKEAKAFHPIIWEVSIPDDSVEFDVGWRDILYEGPSFNFFDIYINACRYWSGLPHELHKFELLTHLHPYESRVEIVRRLQP